MNHSGIAVKLILDYYKKGMDDLFVIYDDLDLQMGTIRIRKSGSAGGHNGMKSIIQCVGSSEFARLRIGIKKRKRGRYHFLCFIQIFKKRNGQYCRYNVKYAEYYR